MQKLSELTYKYKDFYNQNNFNMNPIIWNQNSEYIMNSFNINFRGKNAFVWQRTSRRK